MSFDRGYEVEVEQCLVDIVSCRLELYVHLSCAPAEARDGRGLDRAGFVALRGRDIFWQPQLHGDTADVRLMSRFVGLDHSVVRSFWSYAFL